MKDVDNLLKELNEHKGKKIKLLTEQGERIELLSLPIIHDDNEITLICRKTKV